MKKLGILLLSLVLLVSALAGLSVTGAFAEEPSSSFGLREDLKVDTEIVLTETPTVIGTVDTENFVLLAEMSAFRVVDANYYTAADGTKVDSNEKLASHPVAGATDQVFGETASDTADTTVKATGYYVFELKATQAGKAGLKLLMCKAPDDKRFVYFTLVEVGADGTDKIVGFSDKVGLGAGNTYAKASGFEVYDGNFYVDNVKVNFYAYDGAVLKAKAPVEGLFKASLDKLTEQEYTLQMSIDCRTKTDGTTPSEVEKSYMRVRSLRKANKNVDVANIITDENNTHLTVVFTLEGSPYTNTSTNANHLLSDSALNKLWVQRGSEAIRSHIWFNGQSTIDETTDAKRSADIHQRSGQFDFMQLIEAADTPYQPGDTFVLKKGMPFAAGYGIAAGIDTGSPSEYVGALTGDVLGRDVTIQMTDSGKWVEIVSLTGVSFDQESQTIGINKTVAIVPTFQPENAFNKAFTAVSSDPSVVSVEGETMKGLKEGTAQITITTEDGGFTAVLNVTVSDAVKSIELKNKDSIKTQYEYNQDLDITGMTLTVTYESGKTEDVPVTADMISGYNKLSAGEQTVTVTYEGKRASFNVTVAAQPGGGDKEPGKEGGCGSSVAAVSVVGAMVLLGGAAAAMRKRRSDR